MDLSSNQFVGSNWLFSNESIHTLCFLPMGLTNPHLLSKRVVAQAPAHATSSKTQATAVARDTHRKVSNQYGESKASEPVKSATHTAVKETSGRNGKQSKEPRTAKTVKLQAYTTTLKLFPNISWLIPLMNNCTQNNNLPPTPNPPLILSIKFETASYFGHTRTTKCW